jgi:hypothetical protein
MDFQPVHAYTGQCNGEIWGVREGTPQREGELAGKVAHVGPPARLSAFAILVHDHQGEHLVPAILVHDHQGEHLVPGNANTSKPQATDGLTIVYARAHGCCCSCSQEKPNLPHNIPWRPLGWASWYFIHLHAWKSAACLANGRVMMSHGDVARTAGPKTRPQGTINCMRNVTNENCVNITNMNLIYK